MRAVAAALTLAMAGACSSSSTNVVGSDSGAGGSAAATGGGAGTTAGAGGGSSGAGSAEVCSNGVDDDGDEKADCADLSDCECAPQVVSGWQGPLVVTPAAVADAEPPPCPEFFPDEQLILGRVDAPDATCPTCSCGSPTGGCATATVSQYTQASCGGTGQTPTNLTSANPCKSWAFSGGTPWIGAAVSPGSASCPSSVAGSELVPKARFVERRRVCSGPVGACAAGHCIGKLDAGHLACVLGDTTQSCPPGYSVERDLETGEVSADTRKCTGCGCQLGGATCKGWQLSTGTGCANLAGSPLGPGASCIQATSNFAVKLVTAGTLEATCTPTGGKPNGSVTTAKKRLCCTS